MLDAQTRGLLFELQVGDALAHRIEIALDLQALLVAGTQFGCQIVVLATLGGQGRFTFGFHRQCRLQAGLGRHIAQPLELFLNLDLLRLQGGGLLRSGLDDALQLGFAGDVGAALEIGFLRLALQAAQLITRLLQAALRVDDVLVELRMTLLAVGQHHVEFLEAGIGSGAALLQGIELGLDLVQIGVNLGGACTRLLGLLGQAQGLDLQFVRLGLGLRGFTTQLHQALTGLGIGRFGAHQLGTSLFVDEGLRALLFLQILDFLRASQQSGLLAVGRIEVHAVAADRMPLGHQDPLTRQQAVTPGQGLREVRGGEAALQPAIEQGFQASIAQAQEVAQARQGRGAAAGGP